MKKKLLALSSIILISCGSNNDLLNSENENQDSKILEKNSLIQSKSNSLNNKTNDELVMDLSFETGIINGEGGCSFEYLLSPTGDTHTSTQCYGPNPIYQNGYLIRGYGKPRRASKMRYNPWFGVLLEAKNEPKTVTNRNHTELRNSQESNAISIEFPFQAKITYEVSFKAQLIDYVKVIKSPSSGLANTSLAKKYKEINASEAFSTIDIQLVDTPIIPGNNPCSDTPIVSTEFTSPPNYLRKQIAEKTTQWAREDKTYTFYFSTTEAKNAILIKFLPGIGEGRNPTHVPKSWFQLDIRNIRIVQKPFDPSYVITRCGFRNCP